MSNAMERATHSRGRAPTAAQHKRQILTGSVEIEASLFYFNNRIGVLYIHLLWLSNGLARISHHFA